MKKIKLKALILLCLEEMWSANFKMPTICRPAIRYDKIKLLDNSSLVYNLITKLKYIDIIK